MSRLEELRQASDRLPICDRSARLHAMVARLGEVISEPAQAATALETLSAAARDALAEDPWFQFNGAVDAVHTALIPRR